MEGHTLIKLPKKRITSIDKRLTQVILEAHKRGFSVKSDYARSMADFVAMATSMGLISTRVYGNVFSREYHPTMKGLGYLSIHLGDDFTPDDGTLDWGHDNG